ncbi:DUF7455 domain-containing protein [Actinophytocola xanthii]|uniref:DUF7455 domain-containing protein n=1 Tax=Actinophytocola xanthii TaxID=1912961 RepID=A0A1Q8CPP7_9PSEU|nr:hypothetical protein [Actinophytocola xanthii]OLF16321.1 hypothetical protein BU204_17200 [Actinophytocola xanthii]
MTTAFATPNDLRSDTSERCDRCSAEAKVLALLNTGGELVFCRHHAREHRAALEPLALIIEHGAD